MRNNQLLLEIMEKTISTLDSNKETVVSIIKNLQAEFEKKKLELIDIKSQLPKVFSTVKEFTVLDKQLRLKLAGASSDFSADGQAKLRHIFEQATTVHDQLLKAQEQEHFLIRRRDMLEIDLRHSQKNIEQAEYMANQLLVSLSYLQAGMAQIKENEEVPHTPDNASLLHYVAFLKCLENEKSRIARDLHDGPAQQIVGVQMKVDFCKTLIQQDLQKGLLVLDQLKGDLNVALSEVRDILFDLNPAPLEKMGLKKSIETLLYNALDSEKVKITFYYDLEAIDLNLALQTTLYRIIQELTNNIKKHARATQVVLRVSGAAQFIYIHLMDNGIGFDMPDDFETLGSSQKSYGLTNISTRIKELNGDLKVTSGKSKGTLFKIQLPLVTI